MKTTCPPLSCYRIAAQCLLLSSGLFFCASVSAQVNLLKNGNFDDAPLGPTNWTVLYLHGGPDDYEIKDRTTPSLPHHSSFYDGHFRPIGQKLAHACFTQTVTNLALSHAYYVSGRMAEDWWKAPNDALRDKFLVYIEAIGGQGTPTADGRFSVLAVATDQSNLDAPYTYPNQDWLQFTNRQTPDTNGKIEIRLHHACVGYVEFDKCMEMSGYFDAISLTY